MTIDQLLAKTGKRISDEQRAAILTDNAAVVSAGAGSGKTTVLSLRFVRLVLDGKAHADEILTLTFTRKAAAEMYERIYALLSAAAEEDSSLLEELNVRFPKARISTMDSFWGEIARTDSLRFGVTRDFVSLEADEGTADDMVRDIYEELQLRPDLEEGFLVLSGLYTSASLRELFGRIVTEETDILTSFDPEQNTSSYKRMADLLDSVYGGKRARYIFTSLADLNERYPANGQHAEIETALEAYRNDDYSSLPSFNLNKLRKAADKPVQNFVKDEDLKKYFETLKLLSALKKSTEDAAAVSNVIAAFVSAFQRRKREMGVLSYRDTESLCREVLITNTDVRDYYKNRYRSIMVDEFQDNNSRQRDLLYLLSERSDVHSPGIPPLEALTPGKLFFVGDDKQSIYYFRGADVSVFRSLREDIGRAGGDVLSLSANYRSEPGLIEHFNSVFSSVFAAGPDDEDLEAERIAERLTGERYMSFYADAEPISARPPMPGVVPAIELAAVPAPEKGEEGFASGDDSEAAYIAEKVRRIVGSDDYLIPDGDGGLRRPRYGEIAVLLRTAAPQMPIERAFRTRGIPYVVQESTSAAIEGVGWDIYAFLQLLIYPDDSLAYMAVLRSPFARISDEGLLFLMDDKGPAFSSDPEFRSSSDAEAYASVRDLYQSLRPLAGRIGITGLLTRLFHESGYNAYLMSSGYLSVYAEHYSYIWAAAALYDANGRSLPAFLDYLRPLIGQAGKLKNATVQHLETDGVQIMTIHRSKGLQFPVVIIADADHGSGNQASRSKLISIGGPDPCIMPDITEGGGNLLLRELAAYRTRREEAELRRLLYVALTRAVDHVIVTAHMRSRRVGLSLLDIYSEGFGCIPDNIPKLKEDEVFSSEKIISDYDFYSLPVSPEPKYSERRFGVKDASHREEERAVHKGEELPPLPSDEIVRKHSMQQEFGTMVHLALECLMRVDEPRYVFPAGLSDEERSVLISVLSGIIESFRESGFFRSVVAGRKAETEVRFFYPAEDGVAEGSADLVIFGSGCNLVVDYKTDRFMDEAEHLGQITAYARAMEDLYGKKCLAVLLYVRGWRRGTPVDSSGTPFRGTLPL